MNSKKREKEFEVGKSQEREITKKINQKDIS